MDKKGQMKISFGMIFSIILIIMFLSFAFYSISGFLKLQNNVKENKFIENLRVDINQMWESEFGSTKLIYSLPSSIEKICFVDSKKNMQIYDKYFSEKTIDHIDIEKTLNGSSNLCIRAVDQKIEFKIEKEYGDESIIIKK